MTDQTCKCGKPADAYLCADCCDELARALGEVPWLSDELETTATKAKGIDYRRLGGSKGGQKPTERPLPANWGASEARTHLRDLLRSWVRFCHDTGIRSSDVRAGLPADETPAMSRWLMWRVDGLALHEIGPDAHTEITAAVQRATRIIDRPADARFYGRCTCGEWLYTRPGADTITCRNCGEVSDTNKLNADMWEQAMGQLVTVPQARALANRMGLEVAESTMFRWVAAWVKAGQLVPHEIAGKTDRHFSFRDLAVLLEQNTRSTTPAA